MKGKLAKIILILFLLLYLAAAGLALFSGKLALPNPTNQVLSGVLDKNVFVQTYPHATLESLWVSYRSKIQKDGRTIDRSRNYLTTSEGQSYSLLRAVYMDDKETFDQVLKWTNNNLQKRTGDELFAWKWGKNKEGRWGVLEEEGGLNTASDADQDIALALIFAASRWNQPHYLVEAKEILNDIWRVEVLKVNDDYFLLAGNWAKTETIPTINPSYLSPAYYSIFQKVNPENPWLKLKDTSYKVLFDSTALPLNTNRSANLPPDWVGVDIKTGQVVPPQHSDKTTDYSDDAYRVIWRVALDWMWNEEPRSIDYLKNLSFLKDEWLATKKIVASYTHAGEKRTGDESFSGYGAALPYFKLIEPVAGDEVYEQKIATLFNPDTEDFYQDIGYYAQNWVWFGMAFYEDRLNNLFDEGILNTNEQPLQ